MKKNFSHGSVDQMIDAFENKIDELGGHVEASTNVNAATDEFIDDGEVLTDVTEMTEDEGYRDRYIHSLIGDVESELADISRGATWDQDDENLYLTLVVDDGRVLDFTIPFADLTMDIEDIEPSVQYITDTVRYAFDHPEEVIDVEDEEIVEDEDEFIDNADVESSTDIKAASNGSVLHVEFEEYERFGGGKIRKATVRGTDRLDALYKMLDKMPLPPLDPDGIEEDDLTEEEVIEEIKYNNGDGCDFIYKIEDKTTGETLLDEGVSTEENWDEEDADSSTKINCEETNDEVECFTKSRQKVYCYQYKGYEIQDDSESGECLVRDSEGNIVVKTPTDDEATAWIDEQEVEGCDQGVAEKKQKIEASTFSQYDHPRLSKNSTRSLKWEWGPGDRSIQDPAWLEPDGQAHIKSGIDYMFDDIEYNIDHIAHEYYMLATNNDNAKAVNDAFSSLISRIRAVQNRISKDIR